MAAFWYIEDMDNKNKQPKIRLQDVVAISMWILYIWHFNTCETPVHTSGGAELGIESILQLIDFMIVMVGSFVISEYKPNK